MAQARRIKPKAKKKAKTRRVSLRSLPWGLLTVILASSAVLYLLFGGSRGNDTRYGQGLKSVWDTWQSSPSVDEPELIGSSSQPSGEKPLTEFDYYEVLPDIEQVMPDDLPDSEVASHRDEGYEFFVQAASFRSLEDAEAARARIALQGLTSTTQAREVGDQGLYYRVRLGPFENRRIAKNARVALQGIGFDPLVYRQKLTL